MRGPCKRHRPTFNETCADCLFELWALEKQENARLREALHGAQACIDFLREEAK